MSAGPTIRPKYQTLLEHRYELCRYVTLLSHCDPWCCHDNFSHYYVLQVMNNGTLLVTAVMPSDRGEYKCVAVNLLGTSVTAVLVSYLGDPGLYISYMYGIITCTVNAFIYPLC